MESNDDEAESLAILNKLVDDASSETYAVESIGAKRKQTFDVVKDTNGSVISISIAHIKLGENCIYEWHLTFIK